ncbi:hypothetical protein QTT33_004384 [Salmonella enterica]|nr:hypothetical protein [Salmonella enterica]
MRTNYMSLNRKWILFSLVLLSPAILAAENLNFNYTRADALSMDSRLGLQAKACHSKGNPMDIRFLFGPSTIGTSFKAMLTITGVAYPKSYAPVTSLAKKVEVDPDFLVPWEVSVNGQASGADVFNVTTPGTPGKTEYSDVFCFRRNLNLIGTGRNDAWPSGGFIPIFTQAPYTVSGGGYEVGSKGNSSSCDGIPGGPSENYYWPNYYSPPSHIAHPGENDFYFNHKFYRKKREIASTPPTTTMVSKDFNNLVNNEVHKESSFTYTFPFSSGQNSNLMVKIDKGDFLFKLRNRNISKLTLTLLYDGDPEVWTWTSEKNSNVLKLSRTQGPTGIQASVNDIVDPYFVNKFYKSNNYYKGSLTARSRLTQAYIDYIDNIVPLSLPPGLDGDINLVNTDSLTFTIGQKPGQQGYGSMTFSVYGQPIKFAPLSANGKEVASAMQIRNACY